MKTLKNVRIIALTMLALVLSICGVSAQTNMPDATVIYTGLYTPFNSALTWVIAATAVLVLIGWILRAVSRRK
jgi:hypothetical protein